MTNTYNGYSNYQTWNVCLWADNDYTLYQLREEARTAFGEFTDETARSFVTDLFPHGTPDFIDGSKEYRLVNWREVADAFNAL